MTYLQALDYVNSASRLGSQLGLGRIGELLTRLGSPQKNLKFVHVAGTKGKGSITAMVSSVLSAAGYKTGGYFSPYIIDFRERMQIDGNMIAPEDFARVADKVRTVADEMVSEGNPPTVFELVTACAFVWFDEQGCDIVALEVGLGGRFDATNVIEKPEAAVISVIDFDHTDILGDTLEKIAFEKCGIIKKGVPVVSFPVQKADAMKVIEETAKSKGCELVLPAACKLCDVTSTLSGSSFTYDGIRYELILPGEHQVKNAMTAIEVCHVLQKNGWKITEQDIQKGLRLTTAPARVEVLSKDPLIVVDGAHNAVSFEALSQCILRFLPKKITGIVGMLKDKDYTTCLRMVAPYLTTIIVTEPDNPRKLDKEELFKVVRPFCSDVRIAPSREEAAKMARKNPNECILCFGSLYLATDMRKYLMQDENN